MAGNDESIWLQKFLNKVGKPKRDLVSFLYQEILSEMIFSVVEICPELIPMGLFIMKENLRWPRACPASEVVHALSTHTSAVVICYKEHYPGSTACGRNIIYD